MALMMLFTTLTAMDSLVAAAMDSPAEQKISEAQRITMMMPATV